MIPFHGTPIGGRRVDVPRILMGRHAFISYLNQEDLPVAAEVCQSFAFDNGAYSAWKKGRELDIQGYFDWCVEWHKHPGFAWCVIPDVIDGDESDNNELIGWWIGNALDLGLNHLLLRSAPVYHLHESLLRLEKLMNLSMVYFDRVCIGSSGQWPSPGADGWEQRMAEIMAVACDEQGRPNVRLHGLRMLDPDIFTSYPFASADSTNVAQNHQGTRIYKAPTAVQQADTLAMRIEIHQSSATWNPSKQKTLFELTP